MEFSQQIFTVISLLLMRGSTTLLFLSTFLINVLFFYCCLIFKRFISSGLFINDIRKKYIPPVCLISRCSQLQSFNFICNMGNLIMTNSFILLRRTTQCMSSWNITHSFESFVRQDGSLSVTVFD